MQNPPGTQTRPAFARANPSILPLPPNPCVLHDPVVIMAHTPVIMIMQLPAIPWVETLSKLQTMNQPHIFSKHLACAGSGASQELASSFFPRLQNIQCFFFLNYGNLKVLIKKNFCKVEVHRIISLKIRTLGAGLEEVTLRACAQEGADAPSSIDA